jgi:hypothetical protein
MSSGEPRKASDVILDLEVKIDALLNLARSQDLNIKILSNKVNLLSEKLNAVQTQPTSIAPRFKAEVADAPLPTASIFRDYESDEKNIPVNSESTFKVDESPKGFRRTSRPETYSGDDSYLPERKQSANEKPAEVIVQPKKQEQIKRQERPENKTPMTNVIPVQQRMVDKTGKSIFFANVEVTNVTNGEVVYRGRTTGAGKWMASLAPGRYKVHMKHQEKLSNQKLEAIQEIVVDGTTSPLELPMVIVK